MKTVLVSYGATAVVSRPHQFILNLISCDSIRHSVKPELSQVCFTLQLCKTVFSIEAEILPD